MTHADICLRALRDKSILAPLPEAALNRLVASGWIVAYEAGRRLYAQDDAVPGLMIVLEGRLARTLRTPQGRSIAVSVLTAGHILGELAVLDGQPAAHDAVAVTAIEAKLISTTDIQAAIARYPDAVPKLLEALAARVRETSAQLERVILWQRGALAAALLDLAAAHGRPLPDGVLLDLALSQSGLAAQAGLTPDVASQQLGALRHLGLVRSEGARIVLVDRDALQDYAEFSPAAGVAQPSC